MQTINRKQLFLWNCSMIFILNISKKPENAYVQNNLYVNVIFIEILINSSLKYLYDKQWIPTSSLPLLWTLVGVGQGNSTVKCVNCRKFVSTWQWWGCYYKQALLIATVHWYFVYIMSVCEINYCKHTLCEDIYIQAI